MWLMFSVHPSQMKRAQLENHIIRFHCSYAKRIKWNHSKKWKKKKQKQIWHIVESKPLHFQSSFFSFPNHINCMEEKTNMCCVNNSVTPLPPVNYYSILTAKSLLFVTHTICHEISFRFFLLLLVVVAFFIYWKTFSFFLCLCYFYRFLSMDF